MAITYVDVVNELTKSKTTTLTRNEDRAFFHDRICRISESLATSDLVVIDFERVTEIKLGFVAGTLEALSETRPDVSLIAFNLSPEVFRTIQLRAGNISQRLCQKLRIWPAFDKTGVICCLGVADQNESRYLAGILFGEVIAPSQMNTDTQRILDRNPELFVALREERGTSWARTTNVTEAFAKLAESVAARINDAVERLGIHTKGHYRLPSGRHAASVYQSSLLLNEPRTIERIAMEVVRRQRKSDPNVIVTSSLLGLALAKAVSSHLGDKIPYLAAYGYPDPRPRFGEGVLPNSRALLLADVVSSGVSLSSLRQHVVERRAEVAGLITVIDATGAAGRHGIAALLESVEETWAEGDCPMCRRGELYTEIDPFTSMPVARSQPAEPAPTVLNADEFWGVVLGNRAVREGHWSFNGHHFSVFIETHKILKNSEASKMLGDRIAQHYKRAVDCIVHPTHESAVELAQSAAVAFSFAYSSKLPRLVPASKTPEGEYRISTTYEPDLRGKRVLVVDDGANFGDTLVGIYFALEPYHPAQMEFCVFVDRLTSVSRKKVSAILGQQKCSLTSLFYLPIPAYHTQDCPICNQGRGLLRFRHSAAGRRYPEYVDQRQRALKLEFIDEPPDIERAPVGREI
jgi:orotate phosphoribosyltransferase